MSDAELQKCQAVLYTLYRERLKGVVLYGSCARGTDRTESDIDLMILLEGPVDAAQEIRRIWQVLYPLQLESERLLSVLPVEAGRIISSLFDLRALGDYGGAAKAALLLDRRVKGNFMAQCHQAVLSLRVCFKEFCHTQ